MGRRFSRETHLNDLFDGGCEVVFTRRFAEHDLDFERATLSTTIGQVGRGCDLLVKSTTRETHDPRKTNGKRSIARANKVIGVKSETYRNAEDGRVAEEGRELLRIHRR